MIHATMSLQRWLLGLTMVGSLSAFPLQAQRGAARMYGTVIDRRTHGPISNAQIVHMGDGRSVTSDSLGLYHFDQLATGIVKFMVRAPNYPVTTFLVAIAPGEQMERDV